MDGLIIRTHGHEIIEEFASFGTVPVVNALTDFLHPCQIFADCMTILETTGSLHDPYSLTGKLNFFGDTQQHGTMDHGRGTQLEHLPCRSG